VFSATFLFVSLFWGSVGFGCFIYGKKQSAAVPMVGGIVMMAVSYFVSSALLMSLICIGIAVAGWVLIKRGV
jgi:hypothetical protein